MFDHLLRIDFTNVRSQGNHPSPLIRLRLAANVQNFSKKKDRRRNTWYCACQMNGRFAASAAQSARPALGLLESCPAKIPTTGKRRQLCDRLQRRPLCTTPVTFTRRVRRGNRHLAELSRNDLRALRTIRHDVKAKRLAGAGRRNQPSIPQA